MGLKDSCEAAKEFVMAGVAGKDSARSEAAAKVWEMISIEEDGVGEGPCCRAASSGETERESVGSTRPMQVGNAKNRKLNRTYLG